MPGHHGPTQQACSVTAVLLLVGGAVGVCAGDVGFKERGTQRVFKDDSAASLPAGQNETVHGIMGYGGALTLVNASPYEWTLSSESSYQMDTWKWPNVAAGEYSEEDVLERIVRLI